MCGAFFYPGAAPAIIFPRCVGSPLSLPLMGGGGFQRDLFPNSGERRGTMWSRKLNHLCVPIGHPVSGRHIVTGHTEYEIHRVASETEADLIIVGSHGRHGLALLLGSTDNGVLHGARCDVLAIRVQSKES